MNLVRLPLVGALLAFAFFVEGAMAADPVNVQIMALDETVGTIEVTVSAVGGDGLPLAGMAEDNFRVSLDGRQLDVREFRTPDAARLPAYVVLVVDTSGSMGGAPIEQARNAIRDFVDVLEPTDHVSILSFDSEVAHIQGFTQDRGLLNQAIDRLQAEGETALFDGVMAGVEEISSVPEGRRLVVLLSDGLATIAPELRDQSVDAARQSGVGVVAVGLGAEIDRQYLSDLTESSGGRFLEAPTPESLRRAYTELAYAIRSQYTLVVDVPAAVDRREVARLAIHATYNADNAAAERLLDPLEGALPPPFDLNLGGISAGQSLEGPVTIEATPFEQRQLVSVEYLVDGRVVHSAAQGESLAFDFDPAALEPGEHTLTVRALDAAGSPGQIEVPFKTAEPVEAGGGLPLMPVVAMLVVLLVLALLASKFIKKQRAVEPTYVSTKARSWEERGAPLPDPTEVLPERMARPRAAPGEPALRKPVARLVVMNESALRDGGLDTIREYEMFASPLTFGTGSSVDVQVEDQTGAIAAEEARLWVQRERLVYHKLTTLSAMATEGVTAGWQFLEDGEEMTIGAYRLVFQVLAEERQVDDSAGGAVLKLPQEHGMELRANWENLSDYPSDDDQQAEATLGADASADPFRREDWPNDNSPFRADSDYRSA